MKENPGWHGQNRARIEVKPVEILAVIAQIDLLAYNTSICCKNWNFIKSNCNTFFILNIFLVYSLYDIDEYARPDKIHTSTSLDS